MATFDFVLVGTGLDPTADDFEQRFFDTGCDDATIAFQNGRILAEFTREAETMEEALASAVANFEAAGAKVERIEPDPLATLSDMATRAGITRAAMTNYARGHRQEGFPAPVARVSSNSPLWDWAEVAEWLLENKRVAAAVAEQAAVLQAANEVIAAGARGFASRLREARKTKADALAAI